MGKAATGPGMLVRAACLAPLPPALHSTALGGGRPTSPCAHSTVQPWVCALTFQGCFNFRSSRKSNTLAPKPLPALTESVCYTPGTAGL